MILIIDDVQLNDEKVFFPYISNAFGLDTDGIKDLDKLYEVVSEYKDPLDVIIHDYDEVAEGSRKFAKKVASVFQDSKLVNKKIKLSFLQNEENTVK